jgi:hypothetical protein
MSMEEFDAKCGEIAELVNHLHAGEYRLIELLGEVDKTMSWSVYGCKSGAHWLNYMCGLDLGAGREKFRVARALKHLPMISEAFKKGELSYCKVRAVTRIATPGDEDRFLELARCTTGAQLERLVREYRYTEKNLAAKSAMDAHGERMFYGSFNDDGHYRFRGLLPAEDGALLVAALDAFNDDRRINRRADAFMALVRGETNPFEVTVHVSAETLKDPGAVNRDDPPALEDGPPLAADTVRRLACDGAVVPLLEADGVPLSVGRRTRVIHTALRRALKRRDGGCTFPGCTQRRFLDAHHVKHWADGGETKPENLVLLCRHHHRFIHEGRCRLEPTDNGFQFLMPDGTPVPAVDSFLEATELQALVDRNAEFNIRWDTSRTQHYCGRPDYFSTIDTLFSDKQLAKRTPGHFEMLES